MSLEGVTILCINHLLCCVAFMLCNGVYHLRNGVLLRLRVQLGVNMPAQATRKLQEDKVEESEVELFEVYDVVLYMGIIDILQEYNVRKKLEHACKSLQYDPMTISVVEPKTYAERFINFMDKKVFPEPETP